MHIPTDPKLHESLEKPKRGLRIFAVERHLDLQEGLEQLARARLDDPHALAARWRVIDVALRDHLEAEEDLIIPAYQLTSPEEADELRTEHARIRELLSEIDLDGRRHVLQPQRIRELIDLLRTHSKREDASMYPWAERNLPLAVRRQLFVRISQWGRQDRQ